MYQEFPEPDGFLNEPGYVKSNPLNNHSYVQKILDDDTWPQRWRDAISAGVVRLDSYGVAYNISQIKEKFNGLRFYISFPEPLEGDEAAQEMFDAALEIERQAGLWS